MPKVAIVTGASRGIGAATAVKLAEDGFDIGINYLSDTAAAKQVEQAVRAVGRDAVLVQADVANEEDVAAMFEQVEQQLGVPAALVNNAGILFQQARLVEMDAARMEKVLRTNVVGAMLCCKQAVLRMSTSTGGQGGVIVNVSSAAARLGSPNEYVDYAATKGALDTLTVGLAAEVAGEGIRVNAVRPGFIHTGMHASGGEPNRIERLRSKIPLQRGGQPEEVADAIAYLVSEKSSYVTGAFVDVSGGR